MFENKLDTNEAKDFLKTLYERGEEAEEIAAAAEVMRKHALMLQISDELKDKLIDNCGTGGDKSNTFNISSTVSIILASTGSYVAKHGNRSITSKSGSADMLEALGIRIDLPLNAQETMLEEAGFVFLFAQNHHPAMKHIAPIRKSLDHRTIFNILGPLTNPAGVKKHLIGVFNSAFLGKIAKSLEMLGSKRALVVSSKDGMDEASLGDITYISELNNGTIKEYEIDPEALGFQKAQKSELVGGDALKNAEITYELLKNGNGGPKRDIVILNTALALITDEKARDMQEGIEMANDALDSKKAYHKLNELIDISKKL